MYVSPAVDLQNWSSHVWLLQTFGGKYGHLTALNAPYVIKCCELELSRCDSNGVHPAHHVIALMLPETSPGYHQLSSGPIVAPDNNKDGSCGCVILSARLTPALPGLGSATYMQSPTTAEEKVSPRW